MPLKIRGCQQNRTGPSIRGDFLSRLLLYLGTIVSVGANSRIRRVATSEVILKCFERHKAKNKPSVVVRVELDAISVEVPSRVVRKDDCHTGLHSFRGISYVQILDLSVKTATVAATRLQRGKYFARPTA